MKHRLTARPHIEIGLFFVFLNQPVHGRTHLQKIWNILLIPCEHSSTLFDAIVVGATSMMPLCTTILQLAHLWGSRIEVTAETKILIHWSVRETCVTLNERPAEDRCTDGGGRCMFLRMIESTFVSQVPEGLFGEFLANCCYPHMDWPRAHYHSLHRLLRHVLLPGLAFEWRCAGASKIIPARRLFTGFFRWHGQVTGDTDRWQATGL